MSLRAADARLLLAAGSRNATVLGIDEGWTAALEAAGIDVVDEGADLVVASSGAAKAAAKSGAENLVVVGRDRGALRRRGYRTRTFVVRRGASGPRLVVPLDSRPAVRAALLRGRPRRGRGKAVAAAAAVATARVGLPGLTVLTIGSRREPRPGLLAAAAAAAGIEIGDDWYVNFGDGDDLQRAIWICLGPDARPRYAVKCSRVRGNRAPFDRDERAAAVVARLSPGLRRHAPAWLARFEWEGLPGLVETAADGSSLQEILEDGAARLETVEAISTWAVEVARETRTAVPRDAGVPGGEFLPPPVVERLRRLPAVFQHNDLGTWNLLVSEDSFTVVDWESSDPLGWPLWDVLYFLVDALTAAGPRDPVQRTARMLDLMRGRLPESPLLFDQLLAGAAALEIPTDLVGPLAASCWLHHGRSARARSERAATSGAQVADESARGPLEQIGDTWLHDEVLGVAWPALTRWAGR